MVGNPLYFKASIWLVHISMWLAFLGPTSWSGSFFNIPRERALILLLLTSLSLLFILFLENNKVILNLLLLIIWLSSLFFLTDSILIIYLLMESTLLPIIILLLGYGFQIEKVRATYYLLFYSIACSLPLLWVLAEGGVLIEESLMLNKIIYVPRYLVFVIRLPFLIKFPLYFLHLWLGKVHVEASTSTSMILARVILKIGSYGFYHLIELLDVINPGLIFRWCWIGIILSSLFCLFMRDMKMLIAYSSVIHMSFIFMIMIMESSSSMRMSFWLIYVHGIVSATLFYMVGEIYYLRGTRIIYLNKGLFRSSVVTSLLLLIRIFINASSPPFMSFVVEVVGLRRIFSLVPWLMFLMISYFLVSFYFGVRFWMSLSRGRNRVYENIIGGYFIISLLRWLILMVLIL